MFLDNSVPNKTDSSSKTETDSQSDESKEDDAPVKSKRSGKGLKLLSVMVRDIVTQQKNATYKEVAELILRDSLKRDQLNLNKKLDYSKEEQNVKRRVYDALNVLIAAGVLIKEGKKVRRNNSKSQLPLSEQ